MSLLVTCDRCRKDIPMLEVTPPFKVYQGNAQTFTSWDLCLACWRKVQTFLETSVTDGD